jgi:hypothetical protein
LVKAWMCRVALMDEKRLTFAEVSDRFVDFVMRTGQKPTYAFVSAENYTALTGDWLVLPGTNDLRFNTGFGSIRIIPSAVAGLVFGFDPDDLAQDELIGPTQHRIVWTLPGEARDDEITKEIVTERAEPGAVALRRCGCGETLSSAKDWIRGGFQCWKCGSRP